MSEKTNTDLPEETIERLTFPQLTLGGCDPETQSLPGQY